MSEKTVSTVVTVVTAVTVVKEVYARKTFLGNKTWGDINCRDIGDMSDNIHCSDISPKIA